MILEYLLVIPVFIILYFELIIGYIFLNTATTLIFTVALIIVNIFSKNKASIMYSALFMLVALINSYCLKGMAPRDGLYGGSDPFSLLIMFISAVFILFFAIKIYRTVFGIEEEKKESLENVEKEEQEVKEEQALPVIDTAPEQLDNLRHMATDIINETEHTIRGQKKKRR